MNSARIMEGNKSKGFYRGGFDNNKFKSQLRFVNKTFYRYFYVVNNMTFFCKVVMSSMEVASFLGGRIRKAIELRLEGME